MQELELKELWKTSNEKLEKSINISEHQSEGIRQLKLQHYISSMKPIKILAILIGLFWVGIGVPFLIDIFFNSYEQTNKFFLFSATIQVIITLIALIVYINQLIRIYNINISDTVIKTQKDLATLKSSTLWVTRILILQLPVWSTFYWNETMIQNGNWLLWIFQALITLLITYVSIWLFVNIKYENKDKRWFNLIFGSKEWIPLLESMKMLNKIQTYKKEEKTNPDQEHKN